MTDAATQSLNAPAPGLYRLEGPRLALQRRLTLAVTLIPFAGFAGAVALLWGRGLSLLDGALLGSFYVLTGLGVTIGFHRCFTHRSFDPHPVLKAALAVAGSMAVQGPVVKWVADHRRHHAFADRDGDPHSPHLEEQAGLKGILKGLWHAHVGWFFDVEQTSLQRWAPDLLKDSTMRTIHRLFPVWVVTSFAAPAVLGGILTRSWSGAVTAFLWGSLARIFLLHHVTWSVNSICHYYGTRPFDTTDKSTNNWPLALVSFGESWHNNHHAFPTSAVHGLRKAQIDISALTIRALAKVRLVRDVKIATAKQLEAKAVAES